VIKYDVSEGDLYKLALQSNNAAETIVPSTLVTFAEFVWDRLKENDEGSKDYTQSDVAKMLGWSRSAVSDYVALGKICKAAWEIIAATFEPVAAIGSELVAAPIAATAAFTEGLLRSILDLTPEQQLERAYTHLFTVINPLHRLICAVLRMIRT
jgi:predicted transcriptional regulator